MKTVPVGLLIMLVSLSASAGKFYKWVDEQGVVHYTATAPNHQESETINTQSGEHKPSNTKKPGGNSHGKEQAVKDMPEPIKAQPTPTTKQALAKAQQQTEKNCDLTRKNLETLNTRPRVRVNDPATGKLRYLSPEEITSKKTEAKENIDKFCN